MNCQRAQRFLSLYHDGHPAGREDTAVTAHVRDCPVCREFRVSLTTWSGKARAAVENEPAPRREARSRALDRWAVQREAQPTVGRPRPLSRLPGPAGLPLIWGTAAAALLIGALGLGWWELGRHDTVSGELLARGDTSKQTVREGQEPTGTRSPGMAASGGVNALPAGPRAEPRVCRKRTLLKQAGAGHRHVASPLQRGSFPVDGGFSPRLGPRAAPTPSHESQPTLPDEQYLDGRDPSLLARWNTLGRPEQQQLQAVLRKLRRPADDFVRIPFPLIATAGTGAAAVAAAAREYDQQAKVVDPRLFRKVTLQDKGVALSDLCAELQAQTGVQFRASRTVGDEKVTVFVKEERARDVMRAISHLFGYAWVRSHRDGEYRYELDQDLRSQLAEEELRNRDVHAALLQVDQEMAAYAPLLEMPVDQLKPMLSQAVEGMQARRQRDSPEHRRLFNLVYADGWAGAKLYQRLTPAERAALVSGQELVLRPDAAESESRLPESWGLATLHLSDSEMNESHSQVVRVRLRLDRSELGQLSLVTSIAESTVTKEGAHASPIHPDLALAVGRNSAAEMPENAVANRHLRGQSSFRALVSARPETSCVQQRGPKPGWTSSYGYRRINDLAPATNLSQPHVLSSDVWEAIHRASGMPIVADYYSHAYPLSSVTVKQAPVFDALCQVGDAMGVRWRKEGDFVLGRSTTYYWDRLSEVPNRYLLRWLREKRERPGLSLESLEEMASMPDEALNSPTVGEVIRHCWGLQEWRIVGADPFWGWSMQRTQVRFLSTLTSDHRRLALGPGGLPLSTLTREERQRFVKVLADLDRMADREGGGHFTLPNREGYLMVEYTPAGLYLWTPPEGTPEHPWPHQLYRVVARTATEALAAARQNCPEASADQVQLADEAWFQSVIQIR